MKLNRQAIIAICVWAAVALLLYTSHALMYLAGMTIGILVGLLNFFALMRGIEERKTKSRAQAGGKLTSRYFFRYVVMAGIFLILFRIGMVHLTGFMVGFIALYLILFSDYVFQLKRAS